MHPLDVYQDQKADLNEALPQCGNPVFMLQKVSVYDILYYFTLEKEI